MQGRRSDGVRDLAAGMLPCDRVDSQRRSIAVEDIEENLCEFLPNVHGAIAGQGRIPCTSKTCTQVRFELSA